MRLHLLGLPSISSLDELSDATHLSKSLIFRLIKYNDKFYRVYNLPKRNGGYREIAQPSKELKALQAWINRKILDRLKVSSACKGFERNTSILDNAIPHVGSNAILILDIEDFFPSITVDKVCSLFKRIGYPPHAAAILAKLCTFKGKLPQGSPASPKIANLVCLRLDLRILGYVGKRGIGYTRYADDLTFSGPSTSSLLKLFDVIKTIINNEGFKVNDSKTRIVGPSRQHKVTGLIVNNSFAGIGRRQMRVIRSKVHYLCKYPTSKVPQKELNHVMGWLAFVKGVDAKRSLTLYRYIQGLKEKYPNSGVQKLEIDFLSQQIAERNREQANNLG